MDKRTHGQPANEECIHHCNERFRRNENLLPEASTLLNRRIDTLQDSLREAASQKAEEALEEINQRVLSVSSVIPSRKGVMMNGGQAIGYVNAKDIAGADCETT